MTSDSTNSSFLPVTSIRWRYKTFPWTYRCMDNLRLFRTFESCKTVVLTGLRDPGMSSLIVVMSCKVVVICVGRRVKMIINKKIYKNFFILKKCYKSWICDKCDLCIPSNWMGLYFKFFGFDKIETIFNTTSESTTNCFVPFRGEFSTMS